MDDLNDHIDDDCPECDGDGLLTAAEWLTVMICGGLLVIGLIAIGGWFGWLLRGMAG